MTGQQHAWCWLMPSDLINANHRSHWGQRAGKTKKLRAVGEYELGRQLQPVVGRVHVVVNFALLDRRRRDQANYAPTAKALIDGLTDARIWPDDNNDWVEGPDCRIGVQLSPDATSTKPKPYRRVLVTLTLTPSPRSTP